MKLQVCVLLVLGLQEVACLTLRNINHNSNYEFKKCEVPTRFEGKFKGKIEIDGTLFANVTETLHVGDGCHAVLQASGSPKASESPKWPP